VLPTNHKLRERAKLIVGEAADASLEEAEIGIRRIWLNQASYPFFVNRHSRPLYYDSFGK
jgi:hypothetical protein